VHVFPTILCTAKVLFKFSRLGWNSRMDCKTPFRVYGRSTSNPVCGCKTWFTTTANLRLSKACLPFAWGFTSSLPFTPFNVLRFRVRSCFTTILVLRVIMFCSSSHFKVLPYFASKMVLHDTIEMSTFQDDKPNSDTPYDPRRVAKLLQTSKDTLHIPELGLIPEW
jgi:hypothetical protein